jgi:hypothetical protein
MPVRCCTVLSADRSAVSSARALPESRIRSVPAETCSPSPTSISISTSGSSARKKASASGRPATVTASRLSITPVKRASAGITLSDVTSRPPAPTGPPRSSASVDAMKAGRSNLSSTKLMNAPPDRPVPRSPPPVPASGRGSSWRAGAGLLYLDARAEVAQAEVDFLQRVQRHVGADVAVAVAVRARRADEDLVRHRLFHLVDDVRLGRDDQRVSRHGLGKLQDAAGEPT